jgi:FAD synthase
VKYIIVGNVVKGDAYGRKLGFPTINLKAKITDFPSGIYMGNVTLGEKLYKSAIIINDLGKIEAHLLGYKGDAYRKKVTFEINKFIRKFKKFKTEQELIEQIQKDIKLITRT